MSVSRPKGAMEDSSYKKPKRVATRETHHLTGVVGPGRGTQPTCSD